MTEILDLVPAAWRANLFFVCSLVGVFRLCLKPVSNWVKDFITTAAERASLSADPDDDTWVEALLRARSYKVAAFLLDLFVSVKLPSAGELFTTIKPNNAP